MTAPPTGSRAARRAAREAMQRAERERVRARLLKVLGVAAVVLVLAGLVVAVVNRDADGGDGGDDGGDGRAQRTTLVQLVPRAGQAASAAALVAVDPAVVLTVPATLRTEVPGRGGVRLGEVARAPGGGAQARDALSDQLELVVDGSWVLDAGALAALVEGVGGVTVDVDVDVRVPGPRGTATVVVAAGDGQRLDGAAAAAFAGYLDEDEPEAARLARFVQVLRETVAGLPDDAGEVESRLAALRASSSTQPLADLAAFLVGLRAAVRDDDVTYTTLPVVADEVTETTTYRVDRDELPGVLETYLAGSRLPEPPFGRVEVFVQNGVGRAGLLASARARLRAAQLVYVDGGNANSFGFRRSVVIVPDGTARSLEHGRMVTTALGLPESAVRTGDQGAGLADVVVVLGEDYRP